MAKKMKIGRNDPCPCGSGKKYKRCCLGKDINFDSLPNHPSELTLEQRNGILLGGILDIFNFKNKPWQEEWSNLKKNISGEQIRDLYTLIKDLWTPDTDIYSLMPEPDDKLRALYLGTVESDYSQIVKNIVRYALYTDEILVINPFHNPHFISAEYNPLMHPSQYKQDTLRILLFIMQLFPWIKSGLIKLIPEPTNYDRELRRTSFSSAERRLSYLDKKPDELKELVEEQMEDMKSFFYRMPDSYIMKIFHESFSDAPEDLFPIMLEYVKHLRQANPAILDQDMEQSGDQLLSFTTGGNLETGLFLCQLTGSFPYTNVKFRWKEILSQTILEKGTDLDVWSPLTKAFQTLDFHFLENISANFAYKLHEDGRMTNFRSYLRKIWNSVCNNPEETKANIIARDFADELYGEYRKAEEEWHAIDRKLAGWLGATLPGAFGSAWGLVSTGAMSLAIPTLGFAVPAITKIITTRSEKRLFRTSVPMSVFTDLKHHKWK